MSKGLEKMVSRLFLAGFTGNRPPKVIVELIRQGLGGVVLFARNLPDIETSMDINRDLIKKAGSRPFVIAVDQEGGKVQRLGPPVLQLPPMRVLGKYADQKTCRLAGTLLGRELRSLGFHLDFAPVLDVDTNPDNPIIADRAFSDNPRIVSRLGLAFAEGLEHAGIGACAKHFPGHGDTSKDSHKTLPVIDLDRNRLENVEWIPYRAAVKKRIAAIMVAHLSAPALDRRITSLSPVVYRLLRKDFNYHNLIITDDLEMKAVEEQLGVVEAAVMALEAGADGVLVCHHPQLVKQAVEATIKAVESNRIKLDQIKAANRRWDEFVKIFCRPNHVPDPEQLSALLKAPERQRLESTLELLVSKHSTTISC